MNRPSERAETPLLKVSLPRFILLATAVLLFVGLGSLLAWIFTGWAECAWTFFAGPGGFYLVFLAALEFSLCRIVANQFLPGEPLQPAWFLIMLSGGCHLVSAVCVHVVGLPSPLNPFARSLPTADIYRFGLLVGGPLQLLLMAGGFGLMLLLLRQSGLRPKLHMSSVIPLSIAFCVTCLQGFDLFTAIRAGNTVTLYDALSAAPGPLLIVLLVEACLIGSSMTAVGGMIARCWNSFAAAILFTSLGSIGAWLDAHGLLSAPASAMSGFLGYLAATAYVLGPAWQIEAIQSACGKIGVPRFSPIATSLSALRLLNH